MPFDKRPATDCCYRQVSCLIFMSFIAMEFSIFSLARRSSLFSALVCCLFNTLASGLNCFCLSELFLSSGFLHQLVYCINH